MRRTPQEKEEVWFHNVEHVFVPLDHWGGLDRLRKLRHLAERFDNTRSYGAFVYADLAYALHDFVIGKGKTGRVGLHRQENAAIDVAARSISKIELLALNAPLLGAGVEHAEHR